MHGRYEVRGETGGLLSVSDWLLSSGEQPIFISREGFDRLRDYFTSLGVFVQVVDYDVFMQYGVGYAFAIIRDVTLILGAQGIIAGSIFGDIYEVVETFDDVLKVGDDSVFK